MTSSFGNRKAVHIVFSICVCLAAAQSIDLLDNVPRELSVQPRILSVLTQSDTLISDSSAGDQKNAKIISLPDGGYVIVWEHYNTVGGTQSAIMARRYDANNVPGNVFQVNEPSTKLENSPEGASLIDGGYVIVWQDAEDTGTSPRPGIYVQRFYANNTKYGSQIRAFGDIVYQYRWAKVIGLNNGGYVVVCSRRLNDEDTVLIAQKFDSENEKVEGILNIFAEGVHNRHDITKLSDGSFIVVCEYHSSPRPLKIKGFDLDFNPLYAGITLPIYTVAERLIILARQALDGTLIIGCSEREDPSEDLFVAYFLLTPSFTLKTSFKFTNPGQFWTTIPLADGNFVVVWSKDTDVWARKITTTGSVIQEWIVNSETSNIQEPSGGVSLTDGRFIVVWDSHPSGSGDGYDSYYASFCLDNTQCWNPKASVCESATNAPPVCKACSADVDCSHVPASDGHCSAGVCDLLSTLSLSGPPEITGDSDIILEASINPDEEEYFMADISFVWTVKAGTNGEKPLSDLHNFLLTQTHKTLTVPASLIEPLVEYNFTVSYINPAGVNLTSHLDIVPICGRGTYRIVGTGCGKCSGACDVCEDSSTCLECASFAELDTTTNACLMSSTLSLAGPSLASTCDDLELEAVIDSDEAEYLPITFIWSVVSNSLDFTLRAALDDFLSSHTSSSLTISSELLEQRVLYIFSVNYTNFVGDNLSSSLKVIAGSEMTPPISVDGGDTHIVKRSEDFTIKLIGSYTSCYPVDKDLVVVWDLMEGPFIKLQDLVSPLTPLWLTIPKCTLLPDTTYEIQAISYFEGHTKFLTIKTISLTTGDDTFYALIMNGNRDHSANISLSLEGVIVYEIECDNTNSMEVLYMWECNKINEGSPTPCPDEDSLFGVNNIHGSLIVPTTYFQEGETLEFNLTITRNGKTSSAITTLNIVDFSALPVSISCSGSSCRRFTTGRPPILSANIAGEGFNPSFSIVYNWSLSHDFNFAIFQNMLQITEKAIFPGETLRVTVQVSNSSFQGNAFLDVPYNSPPSGGSLTVEPSEGYALDTYFSINADSWTDEDMPLIYQFYFSLEAKVNVIDWSPISEKQLSSHLTTWLAGISPNITVYIYLIVSDPYGAESQANASTLVIYSGDLNDKVRRLSYLLNTVQTNDHLEIIKMISLISHQTLFLENSLAPIEPVCPLCSGHGSCTNDVCVCSPGYVLKDCSMTITTFQELIMNKFNIIYRIQELSPTAKTEELIDFILISLEELTANAHFNTERTMTEFKEILEDVVKVKDPDTVLTLSQRDSVANIIDHLIEYTTETDCECKTDFCHDLGDLTVEYLTKLANDALASAFPNEPPSVIQTAIYDIITAKTTPCILPTLDFQSDRNAPSVVLFAADKAEEQRRCHEVMDVQVFSMLTRDQLFNCITPGKYPDPFKGALSVSVTKPGTGETFDMDINALITLPPKKRCPTNCKTISATETETVCLCENLVELNPAKQIKAIFQSSELDALTKIGNLLSWLWYRSAIFWINVVAVLWLGVTLYLLKTRPGLRDYCHATKIQERKTPKKFDNLLVVFLVFFNILFY